MAGTPSSSRGGGSSTLPVAAGASGNVGDVVGVVYQTPGIFVVGGADKDTQLNGHGAVLTDAYTQWNGNGYAVRWTGSGTDGDQALQVGVGGGVSTFNANGTLTSAKGIIFPSSDPHIVGAWWDNAGVLTKSAG